MRISDEGSRLTRAFRRFVATEISSGAVLLVAVTIALALANSPWSGAVERFWHRKIAAGVGDLRLDMDLRHWINDGLMVLFFLVVGLEIKRELVQGELNTFAKAVLPGAAALGGMIVPASIYLAFNASSGAASGWGIPMATDIAFALGALALVGRGLPAHLRVFLLSLAIVDDIGAILVIAVFYAGDVEPVALAAAAGIVGAVVAARRLGVTWIAVYGVLGAGLWLAVLEAGVHPTIAGVVMGLLAPAKGGDRVRHAIVRVEEALHPWTSFLVLPVFALANAGVAVTGSGATGAFGSRVTLGIAAGLVAGKLLGIVGFARLAVRAGARLPSDMTYLDLTGIAALAGIGFTMSLFIGGLAFTDESLIADAKLGILVASAVAAVLGSILLSGARRRRADASQSG